MSNIGGMVATLSLDYSPMLRDLSGARGEMNGFQSYAVNLRSQNTKAAGAAVAASAAAAAASNRGNGAGFAGLLRSTGSVAWGITKIGVSAAMAYKTWQLNSMKMKTELMQQQLLLRMLGTTPTPGAASVQWLHQMRGGATATRAGMSQLTRNILLVSGALVGLGGAAALGYGAWRRHSQQARADLAQQKLAAEQLKAVKSSGGSAFSGGLMGGLVGSIAGGAIFQATNFIANIPAASLGLASAAEQAQISFEVMLGSATKAQGMLANLKAYADKSPFDVVGVNAAAQKLLNYGIQAQDVLPTIKMLGDVAAGDMDKFDRLSTAFGQMASTGRLMGQDLLQMINAGFNPLQIISEKTGESMASLKKRMEDGGISALEVRDAFTTATSEGGRFYQMTERQTGSLAGKWSTFKDAVSTALTGVGAALVQNLDLKGWLDYFTVMLGKAPYIVANAGTLLHAELLGWGAFFAETIPGAQEAFKIVGSIIYATWEAAKASFSKFISEIKTGFQDLVKMSQAVTLLKSNPVKAAGIIAGITARRGNKDTGPSSVEIFQTKFAESLQAHSDSTFGVDLAEKWKAQRDEKLWNLAEREQGNPTADFGGELGASFNKSTAEDGKSSDGKANAQSTAALIGSAEAAKIFTAGIGDNPALKIAEESLAIEEAQLEEMKALAANANNFNGLLNPQQSAAWTLAEHDPMQFESKPRAERAALSRGQELNWWTAEADPLPKEPTVNAPRVGMSRGQELNWNKAESNPQPTKTEEQQLKALEAIARSTEETARQSPKVASI